MAWLTKQDKSKYWYIRERVDGKLKKKSTKTTDKNLAQQMLNEFNEKNK